MFALNTVISKVGCPFFLKGLHSNSHFNSLFVKLNKGSSRNFLLNNGSFCRFSTFTSPDIERAQKFITEGNHREALYILRRSRESRLIQEGKEKYRNIELILYSQGRYAKALDNHLKSLKLKLQYQEEEEFSIALSYTDVGNAYRSLGEYESSLDYLYKGLKFLVKSRGEEDISVATCLKDIGLALSRLRKYDEGRKASLKSEYCHQYSWRRQSSHCFYVLGYG